MSRIIGLEPDLIVLSGVAPSDAPLMLKTARELGFQGIVSTETAQDAEILKQVAGDAANGFISVGGASTPQLRSAFMEKFIDVYKGVAGEWNDEAGTKVYALEIILNTIKQAGAKAITDVEAYKAKMDGFAMPNPFLKEKRDLTYVGAGFFEQKRQISVPMVVNVYQDGEFRTLFVGSVE